MKPKKTDRLDEQILNELMKDAKMSLRELSSKLNVSFVTIMNRIKKLEKEEIIEGYSAKLNFEKLNYGVHILLEIRVAKGKLFELEKKIASSANVYAVYDITGNYDAVVLAKFRSTREMDKFLKKIQTFDFVERTNTVMILNTIKEEQVRL